MSPSQKGPRCPECGLRHSGVTSPNGGSYWECRDPKYCVRALGKEVIRLRDALALKEVGDEAAD